MSIQIKQFDIKSLFEDKNKIPTIMIIGRRDTGKTSLINDILDNYQYTNGTIISSSNNNIHIYKKNIPESPDIHIYKHIHNNSYVEPEQYDSSSSSVFIYEEYNPSIINNVIKKLKPNQLKTNRNSFLVLDNCMYDTSWTRDKLMRLIFINGRCWGLMLIMSMSYPLGIPPILRTNISYTFILREEDLGNRRRCWENYANIFSTFESFCSILDCCTEDYECLVIKNNNFYETDLCDKIFWYKASL
jgi:hypothetical protein